MLYGVTCIIVDCAYSAHTEHNILSRLGAMSLHRSKEDGRLPVMCVADTNYTTLRQYIYMRIHFCNSKRAFPFLFFVRVLFLRPRFHHFVFLLLLSICRVCFCTCLFCFSFCPLFYISCFVAFVFIGVQSTPASIQPS